MANEWAKYANLLPYAAAGILLVFLLIQFTDAGRAFSAWISANALYILIFVMFLTIIYFFNKSRAGVQWKDFDFCFGEAVKKKHLELPDGFSTAAELRRTITDIHQLDSDGTWLCTGQVRRKGKLSSVKIDGTRGQFWVRGTFENEVLYGSTDVQKMERRRLTLEQKEAELARTIVERNIEKLEGEEAKE